MEQLLIFQDFHRLIQNQKEVSAFEKKQKKTKTITSGIFALSFSTFKFFLFPLKYVK